MHLHVICFDQPYPPAYGGAVEMYYKLRELHAAGFKLILHIFLYNNAQQQQETERLAEKTYYYKEYQYYYSISDSLLLCRPCNLLEFCFHIFEKSYDSFENAIKSIDFGE